MLNLFVNFNLIAVLAGLSPLLSVLSVCVWGRGRGGQINDLSLTAYLLLQYSTPIYLWLLLMMLMPHKEERFLFIIYPLICFAGAGGLWLCARVWVTVCESIGCCAKKTDQNGNLGRGVQEYVVGYKRSCVWLPLGLVGMGVFLLSASRTVGMVVNYGAPLEVYAQLYETLVAEGAGAGEGGAAAERKGEGEVKVCVGKEWYRFPSHFFLPEAPTRGRMEFILSDFDGNCVYFPPLFPQEQRPAHIHTIYSRKHTQKIYIRTTPQTFWHTRTHLGCAFGL